MKVTVEWLDGEIRTYEAKQIEPGTDGTLRFYDAPYYGASNKLVAAVPLGNVREYKVDGQ